MIKRYQTVLVDEESAAYDLLEPKKMDVPLAAADLMYCIGLDKLPDEYMFAVYIDCKTNVIGIAEISHGSLTTTVCSPTLVYRPAILLNAAGVILAHNHPSGDLTPSSADKQAAKQMAEAGKILGIQLHDFIIIPVGPPHNPAIFMSFKQSGLSLSLN